MQKISEKRRDDLRTLLEDHESVCEALRLVVRVGWLPSIYMNKEGGEDDISVSISAGIAKQAILAQKKHIENELAKIGIQIEPR